MPVVPATVDALVADHLEVHWGPGAPVEDVEAFVGYLLDGDGLGGALSGGGGPHLALDTEENCCHLQPGNDLWSMVLAEELAARLVRVQYGEVRDGNGTVLAAVDDEDSRPWGALESVGVMSLFRQRPLEAPDMNSHPMIPLEDCKITGFSFTEEFETLLDVYFDYWARPCAFLLEEGQENALLYRPMYRFRQAIFGPSEHHSLSIKAAPISRIYGALGLRGFKVLEHKVTRNNTWSMRAQDKAFTFRTRTEEAWLTRSLPVWCRPDPVLLSIPTDRDFTVEELLERKEQHWDITDAIWNQEWFVAAKPDGTLDPFGRIYRADATAALLDLPGLRPKGA